MPTPAPTGPDAPDPVRARVRALATASLARGAPTAWFEELYAEAGVDASRVPWADLAPNPALAAWAATPGALAGARTAAVVGCGLGHDAAHLASLGLDVLGFDLAPSAVAWARRLHAGSSARFEVGDLFALPAAWAAAFDLVVEVYTWQALPRSLRAAAVAATRALLSPGGRLFVYTRLRGDATAPAELDAAGPPWPLTRRELAEAVAGLDVDRPCAEVADPADPTLARAHGVWRRPAPRA